MSPYTGKRIRPALRVGGFNHASRTPSREIVAVLSSVSTVNLHFLNLILPLVRSLPGVSLVLQGISAVTWLTYMVTPCVLMTHIGMVLSSRCPLLKWNTRSLHAYSIYDFVILVSPLVDNNIYTWCARQDLNLLPGVLEAPAIHTASSACVHYTVNAKGRQGLLVNCLGFWQPNSSHWQCDQCHEVVLPCSLPA